MRKIVCSKCGVVEAPHKCSKRYKEKYKLNKDRLDNKIYQSKEWREVRANVLQENRFICLFSFYCLEQVVKADNVHHIIFINDDETLAYEATNLITLTNSVHSFIHKLSDKGLKNEVRELLEECNKLWTTGQKDIGALKDKFTQIYPPGY